MDSTYDFGADGRGATGDVDHRDCQRRSTSEWSYVDDHEDESDRASTATREPRDEAAGRPTTAHPRRSMMFQCTAT